MSVFRREDRDDDWYVSFYFTDPETGEERRLQRRSPVQTKRGAEQHEAMLRVAIQNGSFFEKTAEDSPSLGDFVEQFMKGHVRPNLAASTAKPYRSVLDSKIVPFFGTDTRIGDIGAAQIDKYKAIRLSEGLSPKTVTNHLSILSKLLKVAKRWGDLESVPSFDYPKVTKPEYEWLRKPHCRALVGAAEPKIETMTVLAWQTGMRLGEMLGLAWDAIDWDARTLRVQRAYVEKSMGTPKSLESQRTIPLTDLALETLREHREERAECDEWCFVWDGELLSKWRVWDPLKRAWAAAEIEHCKPGWHRLRHSFASQLASDGVSIAKISKLLGHADISTTMRYAHLIPNDMHEELSVLDRTPRE